MQMERALFWKRRRDVQQHIGALCWRIAGGGKAKIASR